MTRKKKYKSQKGKESEKKEGMMRYTKESYKITWRLRKTRILGQPA